MGSKDGREKQDDNVLVTEAKAKGNRTKGGQRKSRDNETMIKSREGEREVVLYSQIDDCEAYEERTSVDSCCSTSLVTCAVLYSVWLSTRHESRKLPACTSSPPLR